MPEDHSDELQAVLDLVGGRSGAEQHQECQERDIGPQRCHVGLTFRYLEVWMDLMGLMSSTQAVMLMAKGGVFADGMEPPRATERLETTVDVINSLGSRRAANWTRIARARKSRTVKLVH